MNNQIDIFNNMGYEEVDGSARFDQAVSRMKHTNFHKIFNPELYEAYYNAESEVEQQEIKQNTPQITKEQYASGTVDILLNYFTELGWRPKMNGPRVFFYDPLGEAYFQLTNNKLELYLSLISEKLGVPDQYIGLISYIKTLIAHLKFRVSQIELKDRTSYDNQ